MTECSDQITITTCTRLSNVVTITIPAPHPFKVGDTVTVANATSSGTFVLTAVTATTVTYNQSGSNGSTSGGNIRHTSGNNRYRIVTKQEIRQLLDGLPEVRICTGYIANGTVSGTGTPLMGYRAWTPAYTWEEKRDQGVHQPDQRPINGQLGQQN